jgi:hypothetical protein
VDKSDYQSFGVVSKIDINMNKFTILLIAVCLVALAAADPIRKNAKKSKSAKIVRAPVKSARLVKGARRSGKLHLEGRRIYGQHVQIVQI